MRQIHRAVRIETRPDGARTPRVELFGPGREEELFARTDVDFNRLLKRGSISGDWSKDEPAKSDTAPADAKPTGADAQPTAELTQSRRNR